MSTGKIFIYGERDLNELEVQRLQEIAKAKGLVFQFRGPNYAAIRRANEIVSNPGSRTPELIQTLDGISPGNASANEYHNLALSILTFVFNGVLDNPVKEQKLYEGRKRVDITFDNKALEGFFFDLKFHHDIKCPYIFFECKNYSKEMGNPELDQLAGRFSVKSSKFGILVCRSIENQSLLLSRCKDILSAERGHILCFDDSDLKSLLKLRGLDDSKGIDKLLRDKLRALLL